MAYTQHVVTSGTGYSRANNTRMAYLKYTPPPNPNGRKHACIIYKHGNDHCGPTPTSDTDYSTSSIIANKGIFTHVNAVGEDFPRFKIPGGDPVSDLVNFVFYAPAFASTSGGTWPFAYTAEMIKLALANPDIDPSMIYVLGYSLGAGDVISTCLDPFINNALAAAFAIAAGYHFNDLDSELKWIADSNLPIHCYHAANDGIAQVSITENFVRRLNLQHPAHPVQFLKFSGATSGTSGHNNILPTLISKTVPGPQALSNGDTWTPDETIYETMLRYRAPRRKRF
jgi:predicted peptidase